ncbi:Uncharacterized HTH-type transcriptional regulator ydfH [Serratia rubidaea]|uniref:Uncharacterized HTH-type transcriptional regulator ydfH n=1 Tax=Serratia rubidaea TaxID=61652 RepID=A0A4U9HTD3_SERRU|nr:Uncharacterized HTH-type transcriptional regulator ydfH [Serratia rubidaea]
MQILPQRGTFVMKISRQTRRGRALYPSGGGVRHRAPRRAGITPPQLALLEHNLQRQALAANGGQTREFLLLDDEFHRLLTQIANCPLAWETIETSRPPWIGCVFSA